MGGAKNPSGDANLSAPAVTRSDKPMLGQGEDPKRFKLKLSGAPVDLKGVWLSYNHVSGLCDTISTPQEFTWYTHSDNKTYLHATSGDRWMSYHFGGNATLGSWTNAVAWAIDGNRLRLENGNVLTRTPDSKPVLTVAPESAHALTVELVYV
jgi:hypothetical protein